MTRTANIDLYYLDDGQRAADGAMNVNLALLDVLLLGRVQDNTLATPPGSPSDGDVYIVADSATGPWAGQEDALAYWYDDANAWQFITPKVGWGPFYVIGGTNAGKRYSFEAGTPNAWQEYATGGGASTTIISPDTSTTHTATAANNGGLLIFNSSSDCTLTLPEQGTEALEAGWHILVKNVGGGNVSIALEGTDTLDGVPLMQNPSQPITVILEVADEPNEWGMIGNTWIPSAVDNMDLTAPPGTTPDLGAVFIPAATATGVWAGHENEFAIHVGGDAYAFAFVPVGWHVFDLNNSNATVYNGSDFVCPTCSMGSS